MIIGITDHSIDRLPILWMLYLVLGLRLTFFFYYASNFIYFFINDRYQFWFRINSTTGKSYQLMSSKTTGQQIPNLYRLTINLTVSQFSVRDSFPFRTVLTAVHNEHRESNLRKFTTIVNNIWLLCFQVPWDISECGTADTDRHSCCSVPLITALLTIEAQ